jgi:hypothetical protein
MVRNLPLTVIGGILLLLQALAIGLGPGARICLDPACAGLVVAAVPEDCCGGGCTDPTPELQEDPSCDCQWLPITDEPVVELALTAAPLPAPPAAAQVVLMLLPVTPARQGGRPVEHRPPPHLSALRTVLLTC